MTIKQPGARQEHRTRTNRAYPPGAARGLAQPARDFGRNLVALDGSAPRDEEGIDFSAHLAEGLMGSNGDAALGADRFACCRATYFAAVDGRRAGPLRSDLLRGLREDL